MALRGAALRGALIAAGIAIVALPALAPGGIERSRQRSLDADGFSRATTRCPGGQFVTGGGFALRTGPIFNESARTRPKGKRAWTTRVHSFTDPNTWRNFAICRRQAVSIARATEPMELNGARPIAQCPPGRHVVGGGYSVDPPRNPADDTGSSLGPKTSRRGKSAGEWSTVGVGDGTDIGSMTAFAVCERDRLGPVREVEKTIDIAGLPPGKASARARCRRGKRVVSGGFAWHGASASIYASKPAGRRAWKAVLQFTDPPDDNAFLTAYAYCK